MPTVETSDRNQKAVYWPLISYDNDGEPTLAAAEEIDVRWNEAQKQGTDPDGNTVSIDAEVVVGEDIDPNSEMWLGTLAAYGDLEEAPIRYRVVGFTKTPDLKGRNYHRLLLLSRLSSKTPNLA
ncbi:unnamed protein product [marine sediment metagenome]|uniref:Uncharacterized protein n=1 Tax=marine sediment metagenome TaxID=412755 RepID=X0UQW6_9ZZZZ